MVFRAFDTQKAVDIGTLFLRIASTSSCRIPASWFNVTGKLPVLISLLDV